MNCPICNSEDTFLLEKIIMAKSEYCLYRDIIIYKCNNCQHEFNKHGLNSRDFTNYYENIYLKYTYSPSTKHADYTIKENSYIISQKDIDNYIKALTTLNNGNLLIKYGVKKDDHIILDHFLEHCWDLENVMNNIQASSSDNCIMEIAVPASNDGYETCDKYERMIKEHIQHFDIDSLTKLLAINNFIVYDYKYEHINILNDNFIMPVLYVNCYKKARNKVYCYGASRELLYLLENNNELKQLDISGIIDDTITKVGTKINDLLIVNSDIVKFLDNDTVIYITSLFHKDKIKKKLNELGFKGLIRDDLIL